ncbi:MAG TPA: glycosyltransferase family 39 protein, partial [Gaiellaceae bacterium]|nr:glycosyltransferase family 39 protein [Gaiellaceae bacterium]
MTTVPARRPQGRAQRSLVDRVLSAFPVFVLAMAVLVLYAVEAWSRKTPWIFSDELEWTQLSRSIAATGHAARRTEPTYFKSLYAYVIAPIWWWINSTPTAYSAIKYTNAVLMPLAAIPTYLLARMLVSRRSAVVVAVLSISVPAMAYATSIVPDVIGYPYYALCSWLAVRALKSRKRLDVVLAVVFTLGGYFIRQEEFSSLPIALALAAAGLWLTGPRGRQWRRSWTRGDTIGAVVLAFGAFYLFNRVFLQHIQ